MTIFVTFFSVTLKSRELKLGTHLDSGWVYLIYRNHDAAALFLHFSLSPVFRIDLFKQSAVFYHLLWFGYDTTALLLLLFFFFFFATIVYMGGISSVRISFYIGIRHGFSCINIHQVH